MQLCTCHSLLFSTLANKNIMCSLVILSSLHLLFTCVWDIWWRISSEYGFIVDKKNNLSARKSWNILIDFKRILFRCHHLLPVDMQVPDGVSSHHNSFLLCHDRSLPDLEILAESSLMQLLRWSYKTGMDKSMSSSNGQIALVNCATCLCNLIFSFLLITEICTTLSLLLDYVLY
jgi:hypothetical protein